MPGTTASKASPIGFALLGVGCSLAGFAAVLSNLPGATVSKARPNGIRGVATGTLAAIRQNLASEISPENGPTPPLRNEKAARYLIAHDPLDSTALTYLGLVADKKGDERRASTLMALALRSEGRAMGARLWVTDRDLRRRDYASAIDNFDLLERVGPRNSTTLIVAMAGIVRDPASIAPLSRKLSTNPWWRSSFLYALNQQGVSPDIIYRLTPQGSKTQILGEQSGLLQSLLKNKEYERAYLAWINFLPPSSLKNLGPVYDPEFANLPGPLPFNWRLLDSPEGSSEFSKPKGLTISYLGAAPASLTEQTTLLAAGRYRISVIASGADDNDQLSWTVTCDGKGEPLVSLPITGLTGERKRYTAMFDVPASDCGAQRLALLGAPAEFPRTASAVIASVNIEPIK